MEEMYHLHTVFEFFLTLYVGLILAPDFFKNFLFEKVPNHILKSGKDAVTKLEKHLTQMGDGEQRYDLDDEELKKLPGYKDICEFLSAMPEAKSKLENAIEEIKEFTRRIKDQNRTPKDDEDLKCELAKNARKRYDNIFPIAATYCFIILVLNGCHWRITNESVAFLGLSYFNMFTTGFIGCVYFRKFIWNKVPSKPKRFFMKFTYSQGYTLIFMIIFVALSFILPHGVYNSSNQGFLTIVTSIMIASTPMMMFSYDLRSYATNYFMRDPDFEQKISAAISAAKIALQHKKDDDDDHSWLNSSRGSKSPVSK